MKKSTLIATMMLIFGTQSFAGGNIIPPKAVVIPIEEAPAVISPLPFYIGLGAIASMIDRDPCPCSDDGNMEDTRYGGVIRAGYDFNPYFGLEIRGLKTLENDVFSEVSHYGIYAKPQYHISDAVNIYALIGYGRTTVDYDNGIRSSHNVKNGVGYGIGLEYDLGKDESQGTYSRAFDGQGDQEKGWGLWVDFQHLLSDEFSMHTDLNVITAGVTYDF
jgi:OOP family OmpA-OmpF porin